MFGFARKQRKLIEAGGATEEQHFVKNSLQLKKKVNKIIY